VLAVEGLGKRYGRNWVFRGISFELAVGDGLIVEGKNSSGKSTLIRTIAGLVRPTEGVVHLPAGEFRRTVGLCAIEQSLYGHLTVSEHLKFAAAVRGCDHRSEELLELVGLGFAADVLACSLSTGMKTRVKLALAAQARPALLLLDEPGAGLDDAGRDVVDRICREQRERGALVAATNDLSERRLGNLELELS
jgi:ABC-type multidrug transport system ATPase subunit